MAWTSVTKPTGTPYTNINTQGKEQYDQASLAYDSSTTYYDGVNPNDWTDVAKPAGGAYIIAGYATALLMPLTYSRAYDASPWVKVAKPLD